MRKKEKHILEESKKVTIKSKYEINENGALIRLVKQWYDDGNGNEVVLFPSDNR